MPVLVLDAPGVSRMMSEKSAVGGTEFSMIDRLTIACGSVVRIDAVIGVSALTFDAVTTMSSLLRIGASASASGTATSAAGVVVAHSMAASAAPARSVVFIVMSGRPRCAGIVPAPGGYGRNVTVP